MEWSYYEKDLIIARRQRKGLHREIAELQDEDEKERQEKIESQIAELQENEKKWKEKKELSGKNLAERQSELQQFKLFEAQGESYPQSILQFTAILKKGLVNLKPSIITISCLSSSLLILLWTMSGLMVSLPLRIYNQEQVEQVPFKSFVLQYIKIPLLIALIIIPRMFTLCSFLSIFELSNSWLCIVILLVLVILYSIIYLILLHKRKVRIGPWYHPLKHESEEEFKFFKQNFLTMLFIPVDIGNPNESFYVFQNIFTALLYILLSIITILLTTFRVCTTTQVTSPNEHSWRNIYIYQIMCSVQIAALLIGIGAAYLICRIIKNCNLPRMFLWACEAGEGKDASEFLESKKVDPSASDKDGKTCLMWACQQGHQSMPTVQSLLERLSLTDINKRDEKGHTALMYAIEAKQFEFVDRLLKIPNIDVCYSKESGQTCLMWAIEQDLDQTAEKLLSVMSIIDINKKDKSETTAFMHAIRKNNIFLTSIFSSMEGIEVSDFEATDMKTGLILASQTNFGQLVKKLLPNLNQENFKTFTDDHDHNIFMIACKNNSDQLPTGRQLVSNCRNFLAPTIKNCSSEVDRSSPDMQLVQTIV